jgi:hypothetical protein
LDLADVKIKIDIFAHRRIVLFVVNNVSVGTSETHASTICRNLKKKSRVKALSRINHMYFDTTYSNISGKLLLRDMNILKIIIIERV